LKQKQLLLFPLLLLTACDGSNSGGDNTAKSTFDAPQAELNQARQNNSLLAKQNHKLTGELTTANATIVERDKEQELAAKRLPSSPPPRSSPTTSVQDTTMCQPSG
jgi:hypothetical protein